MRQIKPDFIDMRFAFEITGYIAMR
ncbi:pyrroloquinoline quinone precursor peptide PqqA [Caballeronia udeis]